ncbi:hypothetical protein OZZ08_04030 [Malaciobacter mytili]|uniref:hypothetical protein n=1 Tax=Malaciobacter mytili TaxID=603050 RepID=UPI003BAEDBCB
MFKYKDFLENKNSYRWNKVFWKNSICSHLTKVFEKEFIFESKKFTTQKNNFIKIENFVTDKYNNGKLFYDGNPIISGKILSTNKAFRIIQEDPKELGIYYSKFENESIHDINELVIILTLTKENHKSALNDLEEWFKELKN